MHKPAHRATSVSLPSAHPLPALARGLGSLHFQPAGDPSGLPWPPPYMATVQLPFVLSVFPVSGSLQRLWFTALVLLGQATLRQIGTPVASLSLVLPERHLAVLRGWPSAQLLSPRRQDWAPSPHLPVGLTCLTWTSGSTVSLDFQCKGGVETLFCHTIVIFL